MESEPPEIVIVDGDGNAEPLPDPGGRRGIDPRTRRIALLAIGVVMVFALGLAVGSHHTDDASGAFGRSITGTPSAWAGDVPSAPSTSSSDPAVGSSSDPTATTSSSDPAVATSDSEPTVATSASEPEGAVGEPRQFAQATDVCGQQIPVATVSGTTPLPADAASLRLVAGISGAYVDTATALASAGGGATARLFAPDSASAASFAFTAVESGGDIYGLTRSCLSGPDAKILRARPARVSGGSAALGFSVAPVDVRIDADDQIAGLLTGSGAGPYLVTYAQEIASDVIRSHSSLVPLKGGARPVRLPDGFSPGGIAGGLVVGLYSPQSGDGYGQTQGFSIQFVDPKTGAVVRQLATSATNFAVAGDVVLWQPLCGSTCPMHRYDVHTDTDTATATIQLGGTAASSDEQPHWTAVSPDGRRIVMTVPRVDGSGDGADALRSFGISIVDVQTGRVEEVPGVALPYPVVSAAFTSDSAWLVVAVATESGSEVLAYDAAMRGPYDVARLPGRAGFDVPLALLPQQ